MQDKEKLYKNLEIIVKSMNLLKIPIIWVEQVPQNLGPTIKEVSDNLTDLSPIAKNSFSCCANDQFMEELDSKSRKQILLTGIETHICVFQTANDLFLNGYEVQVISDCVSSRTESNRNLGLTRINQTGALITSVEMILFELLKSTDTEGFKGIVKLIK